MARSNSGAPARHRLRTTFAAVGCTAAMAIAGVGIVGAATAAAAPAVAGAATPATTCPQTSNNAKFVRWIYIQILYRCPDSSGLTYWTAALNNGMPRYVFTDMIDMSDENLVENNIVSDFEQILDRAPSQTEVGTWVPKFRSEHGDADLIATLVSSDEYWNGIETESSDPLAKTDQFLVDLYNNVLDRSPDEEGMFFFESILGPNPTQAQRYNVAYNYFELSTENAHDWVLSAYFAAFNRPPDPSGGDFWTKWVLSHNFMTFSMWTQLLASDESYAIAQTQPEPPQAPARAGDRLAQTRKHQG